MRTRLLIARHRHARANVLKRHAMKHRSRNKYLSQAVCGSLVLASIVVAEDFPITPDTDLKSVLKQVTAGDSIVLENGSWRDAKLQLERLHGTADAPIHVRAQTAGQVVFSGTTELRVSGQHVVVSGLVFRESHGVSDVVQLRTHSQRHAHHCRLTDCVFEQTPDSETGIESRWLSVYGTHNRIDHCYFAGKKNRGPTLVVWVGEASEEHRIDHNHFGPRPELGRNGGETIRIGTSDVSEFNCRSVVEANYFHRCNGEAEIISNKSCENIYRYNVFEECSGALTLRHGHRCLVDGNVFLGRKQRGTGGVRIIGQGHSVTNNYFEGLRGDAERAAICLMNGIPKGPLNSFAPVREAVVAHNTFVDCKVSMEFGVGAGTKQSAAPTDCRITHNLFLPGKWPLFRVHAEPVACGWGGNKHQQGRSHEDQLVEFERLDLLLQRAVDGLLRPTTPQPLRTGAASHVEQDIDGVSRGDVSLAGCDEPNTPMRRWPSAANTGPTWRSEATE